MSLLESITIPLGTIMPSFSLKDPKGKEFSNNTLVGKKGLLIVFTCNHCPYAQAIWPRVIKIANKFKELGINTVAINPNINPGYPEDSPDNMVKFAEENNINFPYLVDNTQTVAKQFKAQCTPDIYVLNDIQELVYHGRIDDNWRDDSGVSRHELEAALNALVNDLEIPKNQKPSMGCSIKWN